MEKKHSDKQRCSTCLHWQRLTDQFGTCPIVAGAVQLRHFCKDDEIKIRTPYFGVCLQWKHKFIENKPVDPNEKTSIFYKFLK